jgi:hypothetical protein
VLKREVLSMVSFGFLFQYFHSYTKNTQDVARTRKLPDKITMQGKSTSRYRRELPDIVARVSVIYNFYIYFN